MYHSPMPFIAQKAAAHISRRAPLVTAPVSSPALWLDASDATTMSLSGSNVTQWRDKSGNSNNAGSIGQDPAYSATGLNGRPAVVFDGKRLDINNHASMQGSNRTVFVVSRRIADVSTGTFIFWQWNVSNSKSFALQYVSSSSVQRVQFIKTEDGLDATNAYTDIAGYVPSIQNGEIIHFDTDGTDSIVRINNSSTYATYSTTGAFGAATSKYILGQGGGNAKCAISEVLLYNRQLTARETAQVYEYLAYKWGIYIERRVAKRTYLLSGQSNMEGYADGSGLAASYAHLTGAQPARIYNSGAWQTLQYGVNASTYGAGYFGPELGFGYHMNQAVGVNVDLIKYGKGGRHLANHDTSLSFYPGTGTEWTNLVATINGARALYRSALQDYEIHGILWHQGERDSGSLQDGSGNYYGDLYGDNLSYFIDQLRDYIHVRGMSVAAPKTLIYEIPRSDSPPKGAVVRAAQASVAAAKTNAVLIPKTGITLQGDNIHMDMDGAVLAGRLAAAEFGTVYDA